jgi:hypothetical protein
MAISEWDRRQLCPDGTCVGVIGPDGTCKVCGRVAPDWGDERRRGLVAAGDDAGDEGDDDVVDGDPDEIAPSAPAVLGELKEWHRRRLCADGACVGVIGPDGRCKVCGKPATGDDDAEAAGADADEADEADDDEADDDDDDDEDEGDEEDEDDEEEAEAAAAAGDLDDRKLCPDGACIGVIGPDGRCKVCGKEAAE